jgi:heme/copper-type cytochrome/quinol oxidase subunit 3
MSEQESTLCINETVQGQPEPVGRRLDNRKLGMWIFLATEVMLFSSLIGAFLQAKAHSPATANDVLNVPVAAINTFVLIVSSTAVVMALSSIEDGNKTGLRNFLILTLLLGATFLSIQIIEFAQLLREGFTPSGSLFAGAFFTVTGFHGFHVFIGLLVLLWLIPQAIRGSLTSAEHMRVEVFGLYWHFVDVVWIVLFTIIYLL